MTETNETVTPVNVTETLAAVMCAAELSGRGLSLDSLLSEEARVWRRFIPEATQMVEALSKKGLVIVPLDEIKCLRETVAFYVKAMRLNADPKGKWFKS
jgi:hypothetical protein